MGKHRVRGGVLVSVLAIILATVGFTAPAVAEASTSYYKPAAPGALKWFRTAVEPDGMRVFFPSKMVSGYRVSSVRTYEQSYVPAAFDSGPACSVTFKKGSRSIVLLQTPRRVWDLPPRGPANWGRYDADWFDQPRMIIFWLGDYTYSLRSSSVSLSELKAIARSMYLVSSPYHLWMGEVSGWTPQGPAPLTGVTRFSVIEEMDGERSMAFRASNEKTEWTTWERGILNRCSRDVIDQRLTAYPDVYGMVVTWCWRGTGQDRYRYAAKVRLTDYSNPEEPVTAQARSRVTLKNQTNLSTIWRGKTYNVTGLITPKHVASSQNKVMLRAFRRGSDGRYRYARSFTARYSSSNAGATRYTAEVELSTAGIWKLVASHAADAAGTAAYSAPDFMTVRAAAARPVVPLESFQVTGTVRMRTFTGEGGSSTVPVLDLGVPLDVAEDDEGFGPAHDVWMMQLIAPGNTDYEDFKAEFVGKRVVITGSAWHGHTIHHHTAVLFDVESIATEGGS